MKVYEGQGSVIQRPKKVAKNDSLNKFEFQNIMDKVHANGSKIENEDQNRGAIPVPGGVHILNGAVQIHGPINSAEKRYLVDELEKTLDLVDFYALKLADSSMPARELNTLVDHIEEKLHTLQGMKSVPKIPEKLKPIISDMVITIGAEISKFKRGDYL